MFSQIRNPAAVCVFKDESSSIKDDSIMQKIAAEMNVIKISLFCCSLPLSTISYPKQHSFTHLPIRKIILNFDGSHQSQKSSCVVMQPWQPRTHWSIISLNWSLSRMPQKKANWITKKKKTKCPVLHETPNRNPQIPWWHNNSNQTT